MYFTPALSRTALIAASSVFQRSSWKFDHDTPTVTSFASAAKDVRLTEASNVAPSTIVLASFMFSSTWGPQGPVKSSWIVSCRTIVLTGTVTPDRAPAQPPDR